MSDAEPARKKPVDGAVLRRQSCSHLTGTRFGAANPAARCPGPPASRPTSVAAVADEAATDAIPGALRTVETGAFSAVASLVPPRGGLSGPAVRPQGRAAHLRGPGPRQRHQWPLHAGRRRSLPRRPDGSAARHPLPRCGVLTDGFPTTVRPAPPSGSRRGPGPGRLDTERVTSSPAVLSAQGNDNTAERTNRRGAIVSVRHRHVPHALGGPSRIVE
jgi:hypothetical protein